MQPLNPFLSAFAKSPYLAQCSPPQQHILLVPTTDVILDSRDTETGAPLSASVASDEFIGSHVLRILPPKGGPGAAAKEPTQNLREMKGKPKLYSTINGRTIVIKDNYVYSNKGTELLHRISAVNLPLTVLGVEQDSGPWPKPTFFTTPFGTPILSSLSSSWSISYHARWSDHGRKSTSLRPYCRPNQPPDPNL